MRIVLINPVKKTGNIFNQDDYPPVGLLQVARHYQNKGWKVDLWDGQKDSEAKLNWLVNKHHKPDLVGMSVIIGQPLGYAFELSKQYKELGIPIIWGGPVTRITPYLIPKFIKIDKNYYSELPLYELIDLRGYIPAVFTSIGCPFQCSFCYHNIDTQVQFDEWHYVLSHLNYLKNKFGIYSFKIMDDNFLTNETRAIQILKCMKENNLSILQVHSNINTITDTLINMMDKIVGKVGISIEHGKEQVRTSILNKRINIDRVYEVVSKLKELKISTIHNFIFGLPFTDGDDENFKIMENIKNINPLARGVGFGYVSMPETPLTKLVEDRYGAYPRTIDFWSKFDMEAIKPELSPWLKENDIQEINTKIKQFNEVFK